MTASAPSGGLDLTLTHPEDGIAVLHLASPPANAMTAARKERLVALLAALTVDRDVRVLIVASDLPRFFSAGSDLFELHEVHRRPGIGWTRTADEFEMWETVARLPQVTIAAIDGYALGGGLEFAIACDFRVAGSDASFAMPEISIGGSPGPHVLSKLPSLVGDAAARRLLILADRIDTAEAFRIGLIDQVVAAGTASDGALALARRMVHAPPRSVAFLKRSLDLVHEGAMRRIEGFAEEHIDELFASEDMHRLIEQFVTERRERAAARRPDTGGEA
jgi:enoyl-CoA hydratase/carnithine racemase